MRTRHLLLGTLALSLAATATPALAAKRPTPSCKLITDDSGDGRVSAAPVFASEAADIVMGDIAAGKKTVVGVLKVGRTSTSGDNMATFGIDLTLSFTLQGTRYSFHRDTNGSTVTHSFTGNPKGRVALTSKEVKVTADTIRFTIPRALVPGLKKPKSKFTELTARSDIYAFQADAAVSTKTYVDLYPSCLKPA